MTNGDDDDEDDPVRGLSSSFWKMSRQKEVINVTREEKLWEI